MPVECVAGARLGFYYELVATLLLPLGSLLVILLLAALVYGRELYLVHKHAQAAQANDGNGGGSRGRSSGDSSGNQEAEPGALGSTVSARTPRAKRRQHHHHETSLWAMLNRPQVWTLNIWAWLLLYPSVTRKALQTFDCIELDGLQYLRQDAAVVCYDRDWSGMAVLQLGYTQCTIRPLQALTRGYASALLRRGSGSAANDGPPLALFIMRYCPVRAACQSCTVCFLGAGGCRRSSLVRGGSGGHRRHDGALPLQPAAGGPLSRRATDEHVRRGAPARAWGSSLHGMHRAVHNVTHQYVAHQVRRGLLLLGGSRSDAQAAAHLGYPARGPRQPVATLVRLDHRSGLNRLLPWPRTVP